MLRNRISSVVYSPFYSLINLLIRTGDYLSVEFEKNEANNVISKKN